MELKTSALFQGGQSATSIAVLAGYGDAPRWTIEDKRHSELRTLGFQPPAKFKLRIINDAGATLRSELELFDAPLVFFDAPLVFLETGPLDGFANPLIGLTHDSHTSPSTPVLMVLPKPGADFANPLIGLSLQQATQAPLIYVEDVPKTSAKRLFDVQVTSRLPAKMPVIRVGQTTHVLGDFF